MNKKLLIGISVVVVLVGGFFLGKPLLDKAQGQEPKTEEYVRKFVERIASAVQFKDWNEQYSYLSKEDQARISLEKFIEVQKEGEDLSAVYSGFSISSVQVENDTAKVRFLVGVTTGLGVKADIPVQMDLKYIDGKWYEPMPKTVEEWLTKNTQ